MLTSAERFRSQEIGKLKSLKGNFSIIRTSRVAVKEPSVAVIFTVAPGVFGKIMTPVPALMPAGTDDQAGDGIFVLKSICSSGAANVKPGVMTAGTLTVRSAT